MVFSEFIPDIASHFKSSFGAGRMKSECFDKRVVKILLFSFVASEAVEFEISPTAAIPAAHIIRSALRMVVSVFSGCLLRSWLMSPKKPPIPVFSGIFPCKCDNSR